MTVRQDTKIGTRSIALAMLLMSSAWSAPAGAAKDRDADARVDAKEASFHVYINPRQDSGLPWHGPGDIFVLGGKVATRLPEAPGAVLCFVTTGGQTTCPGQRDVAPKIKGPKGGPDVAKSKKPASPCPGSYDCEFEDVRLPSDEMFAVVVIDPAMAFTNLVDAVIITRRHRTRKDPDVMAFDKQLRSSIAALAPPGPFESKRRERRFQVRTLDECDPTCKLTQSELAIDLD